MNPSATPPSGDESEILTVLQQLVDTWNDGDGTRYGEHFTEDAKYVTFFGLLLDGRKAIQDQHTRLFTEAGGKARMRYNQQPLVQFLHPDVALVVATGGVNFKGNPEPDDDKNSTYLYVAVRQPEGWRLASFQNTRFAPIPQEVT